MKVIQYGFCVVCDKLPLSKFKLALNNKLQVTLSESESRTANRIAALKAKLIEITALIRTHTNHCIQRITKAPKRSRLANTQTKDPESFKPTTSCNTASTTQSNLSEEQPKPKTPIVTKLLKRRDLSNDLLIG